MKNKLVVAIISYFTGLLLVSLMIWNYPEIILKEDNIWRNGIFFVVLISYTLLITAKIKSFKEFISYYFAIFMFGALIAGSVAVTLHPLSHSYFFYYGLIGYLMGSIIGAVTNSGYESKE